MERATKVVGILGALVFVSCTDNPQKVRGAPPTPTPSASTHAISTVGCNKVRIPRDVELDTNLDRENRRLTVTFTPAGAAVNRSVAIRYRRPSCSYRQNRSIRRVIVHALTTSLEHKSRGTYVIADCFDPVKRPPRMVLACADNGLRANHLKWSSWTTKRAEGRGIFVMKDFTAPDHSLDKRLGRVVLTGRRFCINHERFTFWSGKIILDEPAEGRRRIDIYPSCGVRN